MKTTSINNKPILFMLFTLLILSCGQKGKQYYNESIILEGNKEPVSSVDVAYEEESTELTTTDIASNPVIPMHNTEEYDHIVENNFKDAKPNPLSTFSIDVDKASYTNTRRFIEMGQLPPKSLVRIEEFINYFPYDYPNPIDGSPFSITTDLTTSPWEKEHLLLKIGLQGKKIDYNAVQPSNLVFLIDVSGSMEEREKLPLLIKSFQLMVNELPSNSTVSLVTYAGKSGLVLPPTFVDNKKKINNALNNLKAGGSTAVAQGIELAYKIASENHIEGGNNRVILATDGDFNVGISSTGDLVDLIQDKAKQDIFLTICGFGMGNYKDGRMEQISNIGNGNYFYIDNWKEAQKVFKTELLANLFTIAKDVKIQVEFNPNTVASYRLIGYENRLLNDEDFNDDTKDAGELGAGHNVTALYEVVPTGQANPAASIDDLKYQKISSKDIQKDLVTIKLRYKALDSTTSKLLSKTVYKADIVSYSNATKDTQFASAVASFAMILRNSKYKGNSDYNKVIEWAITSLSNDNFRKDFIELVEMAKDIHVLQD